MSMSLSHNKTVTKPYVLILCHFIVIIHLIIRLCHFTMIIHLCHFTIIIYLIIHLCHFTMIIHLCHFIIEMEGRRYSDTLKAVYSFNPAIVPQVPAVDNVLWGGELLAMCHETTKEERNPPLPGSEVLTSVLRHTGSVLQGVAHSWHRRRMTC